MDFFYIDWYLLQCLWCVARVDGWVLHWSDIRKYKNTQTQKYKNTQIQLYKNTCCIAYSVWPEWTVESGIDRVILWALLDPRDLLASCHIRCHNHHDHYHNHRHQNLHHQYHHHDNSSPCHIHCHIKSSSWYTGCSKGFVVMVTFIVLSLDINSLARYLIFPFRH